MTLSEKLQAIQKVVFGDIQPNQFVGTEYTLMDGTKVLIDKMEVGGIVMIGDQPAPAGEHQLQDGTMITVAEGGVISEISSKQEEMPEEEMKKKQMMEEEFASIKEKVNSYEGKFEAMASELISFKSELSAAKEGINQLIALVEKISEIPAAQPAQPSKNGFMSAKPVNEDKLKNIGEMIKALKNK